MAGRGRTETPPQRDRRFRLAFVCHCLRPDDGAASRIGGAERAASDLLAAFRERGDVEVRLLAASAASDRLGFLSFAIRTLAELARLARAGEIDAVLFTAFPTAWMSVLLAPVFRRHGVARASICHGHDITFRLGPYQWLVRQIFAALDAVLPVSRATAAECLMREVDPERLQVICNGAALERFAPPPPLEARRGILEKALPALTVRLDAGSLVICAVGRQVARKGHAWFVREVMPKLGSGVEFWLVGDGPEAAAIAAAVRQAGVEDRVRRLGAISDAELEALYRGADLMVMPNVPVANDIEGFGIVILEANLHGLPVVASNLEGPAEVVAEGISGRLVQPLDAEAFAAVIEQLRTDPEQRRRLGVEGAAFVRRIFGWAPIADQHIAVLRAAWASASARPDQDERLDLIGLTVASSSGGGA
jgi:phosphatidylinositol alpha-1,6-mannosyltransferase